MDKLSPVNDLIKTVNEAPLVAFKKMKKYLRDIKKSFNGSTLEPKNDNSNLTISIDKIVYQTKLDKSSYTSNLLIGEEFLAKDKMDYFNKNSVNPKNVKKDMEKYHLSYDETNKKFILNKEYFDNRKVQVSNETKAGNVSVKFSILCSPSVKINSSKKLKDILTKTLLNALTRAIKDYNSKERSVGSSIKSNVKGLFGLGDWKYKYVYSKIEDYSSNIIEAKNDKYLYEGTFNLPLIKETFGEASIKRKYESMKVIRESSDFDRMLLGRLAADCKYILGACQEAPDVVGKNKGALRHLWAGEGKVEEHIAKMRELLDKVGETPEVTKEDIDRWEKELLDLRDGEEVLTEGVKGALKKSQKSVNNINAKTQKLANNVRKNVNKIITNLSTDVQNLINKNVSSYGNAQLTNEVTTKWTQFQKELEYSLVLGYASGTAQADVFINAYTQGMSDEDKKSFMDIAKRTNIGTQANQANEIEELKKQLAAAQKNNVGNTNPSQEANPQGGQQ